MSLFDPISGWLSGIKGILIAVIVAALLSAATAFYFHERNLNDEIASLHQQTINLTQENSDLTTKTKVEDQTIADLQKDIQKRDDIAKNFQGTVDQTNDVVARVKEEITQKKPVVVKNSDDKTAVEISINKIQNDISQCFVDASKGILHDSKNTFCGTPTPSTN